MKIAEISHAGLSGQLKSCIDNKIKPLGSLGRLEAVAMQLGMILDTVSPQLCNPHLLLFAADHGAVTMGVSAYPQSVTRQMIEAILAGKAASSIFARQYGLTLRIIDAGVNHDFSAQPDLINVKIAYGTACYITEPAMTSGQCFDALHRGRQLIHQVYDSGSNVILLGEMGIGNTASASLITYCMLGEQHCHSLEAVTGHGAGLDAAGLALKTSLLHQALQRGGMPADPLAVLSEYGGFEIAMMAGAILGAAEKRMVIMIDGFIVTAALLIAHALNPSVLPYCIFAHLSEEPGHQAQLRFLDARPLLQLGLRLGEGTGAALAFPLLQSAAGFINDMASFADVGIIPKAG